MAGTITDNLNDGITFLEACFNGEDEKVKELLKEGINPNLKLENGPVHLALRTPLLCAIYSNHDNIVKLLLEKGALVDFSNKFRTPLEAASGGDSGNASLKIAKLLVSKGADLKHQKKNQDCALCFALMYGHEDVALYLIHKGMSNDHPGNYGRTHLHYAVHSGSLKLVKAVLNKGVPLNVLNSGRDNVLIDLLTMKDDPAMVKFLLDKQILLKTEKGKDPIEWATVCKRYESRRIIEDYYSLRSLEPEKPKPKAKAKKPTPSK